MKKLYIDNIQTNYNINENGEIYNSKTNKMLTGTIRNGYKMVKLTLPNKIKKDYLVHRLVAMTFLPNPNNLPEVNHIDRNQLNNNIANLEWVSSADNIKHKNLTQTNSIIRQPIIKVEEEINEDNGWKVFLNTNYWVKENGKVANKKTGKYLNPVENKDGYLRLFLYINSQKTSIFLHRLVYQTYYNLEEIPSGYQINHIDGNKKNNSIENLELITAAENVNHSYYVNKKNIKPVQQYDLENNLIATYPSISEAARQNNYAISGISQACNGKINIYKGYKWKI